MGYSIVYQDSSGKQHQLPISDGKLFLEFNDKLYPITDIDEYFGPEAIIKSIQTGLGKRVWPKRIQKLLDDKNFVDNFELLIPEACKSDYEQVISILGIESKIQRATTYARILVKCHTTPFPHNWSVIIRETIKQIKKFKGGDAQSIYELRHRFIEIVASLAHKEIGSTSIFNEEHIKAAHDPLPH